MTARYSFLPWLRRGIANQIKTPATTSRANIAVTLTLTSDVASVALPPKNVQLVGPGDITGCTDGGVIRTEPRAGVTDFEPNYLACIEFYDEDLAWRHTPAPADTALHRLAPWLTLLVLKRDEFDYDRRPGRPLRSIKLKATIDPKEVFPPDDQLWAWAHVHMNQSLGADHALNLESLDVMLRQNPDVGYCRLICPRRLAPDTAYQAFVIPTFEPGRLCGLGEKVVETQPGATLSWNTGRHFPVYYEWKFATGPAGDFEELVRQLKPRRIPKEVGVRDLDIQRPGFHLPPIHSGEQDIVGLEGALLSPFSEPRPLAPDSNFPPEIEKTVNLGAITTETGAPDGDPVVTAPLYGRWHALVDRMSALPENVNWVNELNADPRFRAAAGMGTLVVRKNQEEYMRLAWQQIGEILALNRKIVFVQVAYLASESAFGRHLAALPPERAMSILAPVYSKVMGSPVTVRHLVKQSTLTRATFSGPMRKLLRPRGLIARRALPAAARRDGLAELARQVNAGKISASPPLPPPPGPTLEQAIGTVTPKLSHAMRWVVSHAGLLALLLALLLLVVCLTLPLAVGIGVFVAGAAGIVAGYRQALKLRRELQSAAALAPANLTPAAAAAMPPNSSFKLTPGGQDPPTGEPVTGPDSVEMRNFRVALIDFHERLAVRPPPLPVRPQLLMNSVHASLMRAVRPANSFPLRAASLLRVGDRSVIEYARQYADTPPASPPSTPEAPTERIVPAMAYPDIRKPMYEPLRDISSDLFVPNLDLIQRNTISLMVQNQPFIEAYMVGLNHEFARELLWREYPTDQRPSSFRQFWDVSNCVDREGLGAKDREEKLRDIPRMHEWPKSSRLGDHDHRAPGRKWADRAVDPDKRQVVLVIRGDVLKRYPRTIICAQRARWSTRVDEGTVLSLWDEEGKAIANDPKEPNVRFPLYRARVDPDIHFIGFDLELGEVRGAPNLQETAQAKATIPANKLGWFFVLQEVVGAPRFGMDERIPSKPSERDLWENLSWKNFGKDVKIVDALKMPTGMLGGPNPGKVDWGRNAADLAYILYQKPVMVAVHARDMLKEV